MMSVVAFADQRSGLNQKVPPSSVSPSTLPPVMATAPEFCAAIDPRPRLIRAADASPRSERFEALASLPASEFVTVAEKFASLPRAAASSLSVSRAPGEPLMTAATAAATLEVSGSYCAIVVRH